MRVDEARVANRHAGRLRSGVLFLFACTAPPTASDPPVDTWRPPDGAGFWPVGVRTESAPDPRGGELTVEIWYPSDGSGPTVDYGLPYELPSDATRDPPAADGIFPVLAFSHGNGGARLQSVFLTERLASHGFVVIAVDHPGNTLFDYDASATPTVAARRPDDVRYAIDHLLAPGHPLAPVLDPDHLGVIGHSFGAWTSLVLAGGTLDLDAGRAHCANHDPAGCGIVGDIALDGPVPEADPRIDATVLLAPGGWYSFATLDAVAPVLQLTGSRDGDLPVDEEQAPTYAGLGEPKTLMTLERAGHFGFTDGCALLPIADCAGEADGYLDPLRIQELTATAVTAWLGATLREEERYTDWLAQEAWESDVSWESSP